MGIRKRMINIKMAATPARSDATTLPRPLPTHGSSGTRLPTEQHLPQKRRAAANQATAPPCRYPLGHLVGQLGVDPRGGQALVAQKALHEGDRSPSNQVMDGDVLWRKEWGLTCSGKPAFRAYFLSLICALRAVIWLSPLPGNR
jgi:hypothetical protein